jgi:protein-tyrosine phosphatase
MATILIVGAADTGRAPMAATLLRRLFEQHQLTHTVESCGILGHDGDEATAEAQQTMEQINLDISQHLARSLTDELAAEASLLVAVDSGVARVARARFPDAAERIHTLGQLASRPRDIPDPFKMQLGAWLTYTQEIDAMLRTALPQILEQIGELSAEPQDPRTPEPAEDPRPTTQDQRGESQTSVDDGRWTREPPPLAIEPEPPSLDPTRSSALTQMRQLLTLGAQMPGIVDWAAARAHLQAELQACEPPLVPGDLAPALVGAIRAALAIGSGVLTPGQIEALQGAIELLHAPVSAGSLSGFLMLVGRWGELE